MEVVGVLLVVRSEFDYRIPLVAINLTKLYASMEVEVLRAFFDVFRARHVA